MKKNKLFVLFISTLYLSAFTFGGGYVIVTLMRKKFVKEYHWIDEEEMLDLIAIAQSSPGPIAVNGAIVVGYKLYGLLGIVVSVLGTIIPPFIIISLLSVFYNLVKNNMIISLMLQGMQAGVGAVICSVVFSMANGLLEEKQMIYPIIMVLAFIANIVFGIKVTYIILTCLFIGVAYTFLHKEDEK